jgi:arsenate reductase
MTSTRPEGKKKGLFLCTHNSARSQMAEGLLRATYGGWYEVYSAGVEATRVDPRAIEIMQEIDIDISSQRSKKAREFQDIVFDVAVTVCDRAKQACPICSMPLEVPASKDDDSPRARKVIHKSFDDPASAEGSKEEQLHVFRRVRDDIKGWITETFKE